jgi:hypothetical protein
MPGQHELDNGCFADEQLSPTLHYQQHFVRQDAKQLPIKSQFVQACCNHVHSQPIAP